MAKSKLELTWIGKENRPRLEPRILLEDPERSYHAIFRVKIAHPQRIGEEEKNKAKNSPQIAQIDADEKNESGDRKGKTKQDRSLLLSALSATSADKSLSSNAALSALSADKSSSFSSPYSADRVGDLFDNRLIFGDNLLALKALEQEFTGKVKCIFIDPPYNTGSAFTHYDDGVEHSIWLSLMRDRLELLRKLLSEDGSLWITIDDNEAHYLKVLCDEVFGRVNFIANVIWQKKFAPQNDAKLIDTDHDQILIFAKNKQQLALNLLPRTDEMNARYKNPDNDPRGPWTSDNPLRREFREYAFYEITTPSGRKVLPPPGSSWRFNKEEVPRLIAENRLWFGKDGGGVPRIKRFLCDVKDGIIPQTIWLHDQVGNTQEAKKEVIALNKTDIFDTPKPERLVKRVLNLATNPGDLVLDSFAGSGTTGAVAHKMGRRWIMVELGEHCHTHIIPRLKKVIDGEDPGGITSAVGWKGGGGFRYYRLAPSLLEKDAWGNWVINKAYNAAMLAQALCKLEGFTYEPSDTVYWQHGHSTERDFLYVTTQNLSHDQLQALSDEVGHDRTLLVLCTAFRGKADRYPNLTIKKIPKTVMARCEWGKDDYSLQVENLPKAPPPQGQQGLFGEEEP